MIPSTTRRLRCASSLAFLAALSSAGTISRAQEEVVDGPLAAKVDSFLTRLAGFDYSGSILIEREGKALLRKAYGCADRPAARAYTTATAFDIGSLAKQFTAAAVLELESQGKLAVSDPLKRFLPDAPADKAEITLHQLLTHTAGLAGDFPTQMPGADYEDVDEDTAVRRILATPLDFAPGSSWSYSNCGYVLLAAIVHRASGRDYRDFVRDTLFLPAGMKHTGFWGTAPPPDCPVALGHDGLGNVVHDPARMRPTWYDLGGGEVWSTLADLRTWMHALADGSVLGPEGTERLFEPRAGKVGERDGSYAYGWFVQETRRGTRVIQHGGDYLGTGVELEWFVDEDVLVITSTNVRHDVYPTRNRVDRLLQGLVFDDASPPEVPSFAALDAPSQPGLEGAYALDAGGLVHVLRIHGRLYVGAEGQPAVDVLACGSRAQEEERAWCSQAGLAAIEGALRHERAPLEAVLGPNPNPAFAGLLEEELAGLVRAHGELRRVTLIGTFASGYPHGSPPTTETTLLRLECSQGDVIEAIRWGGRAIAWTEVVPMPLACLVPLQLGAEGTWHGWKIVEAQALSLRPLELDGAPGLEIQSGGRKLLGRRP